VIDNDGFRPNVGIIVANDHGQVLWARRIGGQDAWQFPQGGINPNESAEQALYRELYEEVGLAPEDVEIVGSTRGWLRYLLPKKLLRRGSSPLCIGQKQRWYLLRLLADESKIDLHTQKKDEFDHWRWVNYWYPLGKVVSFKRDVYRKALRELAPLMCRLQREHQAPLVAPPVHTNPSPQKLNT
jgi:putative (di)nucleoside polyphosphate hydrolase